MIEPLNQVFDQHCFLEFAQNELQCIHQYQYPLSLLIITLNSLPQLEHNHFAKDEIMQSIGQSIRCILRRDDCFAYLSQEEFAALLPLANTSAAISVAQRLCSTISELSFIVKKHSLRPSISIGIASYQESDENLKGIVERANQALAMARNQGRNCFIVHPLDLETWLTNQKKIE